MTTAIVPTIETSNNELVVSSEQIALGAGVEHRATLQLIKTNQAELEEFGTVAFEMRPLPGGGNPVRIALLNEPQAVLLMTFQRNTAQVKAFKVALIKEFKRLAEAQRFDPASLTRRDILLMALDSEKRAIAAEALIEQNAGKVAYVDNHVKPEDVSLFGTIAKNLEVAQKDLRDALIYRRWIYISKSVTDKEGRTAHEYSACAGHANHFRHCKIHTLTGKKNGWHTLKLTPEGVAAVTQFVERINNEFGSVKESLPALKKKYDQRRAMMRAPRKDAA